MTKPSSEYVVSRTKRRQRSYRDVGHLVFELPDVESQVVRDNVIPIWIAKVCLVSNRGNFLESRSRHGAPTTWRQVWGGSKSGVKPGVEALPIVQPSTTLGLDGVGASQV
jgi:hypothetical protein